MRTLTAGQIASTAATVTTPAYLVEILFTTAIRLSTRGDQSWGGYSWTGGRLGRVSGLTSDGRGDQRGKVELINSDLAYSALVLNEGVADRPCRVWQFYGDNPTDAALIFDGVCDGADIGPDRVSIDLIGSNTKTGIFPRRFIGPSTGFNHLSPRGKKITWGGQTYIINRDF